MPIYKICRVCLRTDFELRYLNGPVLELFQEFCGKTKGNTSCFCCSFCHHLLKKYSSFKNKCLQSNQVLENWRITKSQNKPALSDLHKDIQPSSYGIFTQELKYINIFEEKEDTDITVKLEKYEDNYSHEIKTYNNDKYRNDKIVIDNNDENIKDNDKNEIDNNDEYANDNDKIGDDLNDNDTDDDKCLIDFVKPKVKEKLVKIKKKKSGIQSHDNSDETYPKNQKPRKPLKDLKEYESVFDIQLFNTDAEIRHEFAARHISPRYLEAPYKCDICYTVYKCQKLADFHMKWHLAPYKCDICYTVYICQKLANFHMKWHLAPYKCDICYTMYICQKLADFHMKWHRPSAGEFPCDVCAMRFKSHSAMRKHKTDVHIGRFACKKCPLITYHRMVMILHYRKHQGFSYVCKICNKTYNHSSTYMSHLRKSHRTEHVCVTCAQTFVSEKGLLVHRKKVHNASSKFDANGTARCTQCDLTFANQQVYTVHLMNTDKHKDKAEALIACPECGIQFPDKLAVRAHRREMHPQYNFSAMKRAESGQPQGQICPLCGASGTHNTWLYRHFLESHPTQNYEQCVASERRKHLCDQCGKSFFNITQLREHAFAHAGLKPFRCDQCSAAFSSKSHLKFHSERHAPPRRECSHCGKKFVSAANLSNHVRSHIGDRRYKCTLCGKGFLHCAALREHVRGVHLHIRRQRKCK